MTANDNQKDAYHIKVAWATYYLLALVIASVLVLFVAQDNEERFFYGLMTLASAYVFRPEEKVVRKLILKVTGVSQNTDKE